MFELQLLSVSWCHSILFLRLPYKVVYIQVLFSSGENTGLAQLCITNGSRITVDRCFRAGAGEGT
jgi:hypothetical protein